VSGVRAIAACAAWRCTVRVTPGMLMCKAHWMSLPMPLRIEILETYRAHRLREYSTAVQAAMDLIAKREGVFTELEFGGECKSLPRQKAGNVAAAGLPADTNSNQIVALKR
jgi:hypothetical protein